MKSAWTILLAAMAATTAPAFAGVNLVQNGSFETNGGNGQLAFNTSVTDWSVPALNGSYWFLYAPGTADTTGSNGQYGNVALWGPGNGSANGLPATSPDGGYFLASDPSFQSGALTQTITGLKAGKAYEVSFDWAAAQQFGFTGPTFEGWDVSLGSSMQSTGTVNIPSHGFQGWMTQTFDFTATSSSETLSFLAIGGPNGSVPPFALLDGVSLTAVPESSTWAMMLLGFAGLSYAGFRSRRTAISIA